MEDGAKMVVELPDDILHLLCEELADERDFDTLFACAVSGKRLAIPALTAMYRSQNFASVKGGGSEALPSAQQLLVVQKWSILWRSIILSSLGKTLFPYCKYIRGLDFRDLNSMLDDEMFRGEVMTTFFGGELATFHDTSSTPSKNIRGRTRVLQLGDAVRSTIIDSIGDVVTQQTPLVEQITGPVSSEPLVRWIPRLPRLMSLQLWDGNALGDERIANLITVHCPDFNDLSLYQWPPGPGEESTDHKLATFISGLPEQHLKSFETISITGIGAESFLALNSHGLTLRQLKMYLKSDALPHLGLLKGCVNLETLSLEDGDGTVDLERTQNDVFLEMIAWLRDCHKLRHLTFTKILSGAAIMTQVLPDDNIRLEQLQIDSYTVKDHQAFHSALTSQTSLSSLFLQGNSDNIGFYDKLVFVESIVQLRELRDVKLVFRGEDMDLLSDSEIQSLAANLGKLEEFYVSGYGVTDATLDKISGLKHLRAMTFFSITSFTVDGLLGFVSRLGPGNQDLSLVVDMADPASALTDAEHTLVREALYDKVGGRFEYQLLRGKCCAIPRRAKLTVG